MTDLTQFDPLDREQVEEELQWCAPPMLLWLAWQSPRSAASRLSALISARRSVLRLADDPSQENSAMTLYPLPSIIFEQLVRTALLEDLGQAGDITGDAIVSADRSATLALTARQPGIIAGLDIVRFVFQLLAPGVDLRVERPDGSHVSPGQTIATVDGPAHALLTGERTALNFLCHLSGIATATASLVSAVSGTNARIVCTRKTTPGLRALEKYAVRAGGGSNHRFGLDDAVLIKDNHIALAGGVRAAVDRVKARVGHLVKIEIEVDTLLQLEEVLTLDVDAVLLDNMTPPRLKEAVAMVGGRFITEASGGITPATAPAIAATGVDLISVGWLTHSTAALDIGLDYEGLRPASDQTVSQAASQMFQE
jgi:nicotinate-nucleotide pyrophosphorylase (carboxylating)